MAGLGAAFQHPLPSFGLSLPGSSSSIILPSLRRHQAPRFSLRYLNGSTPSFALFTNPCTYTINQIHPEPINIFLRKATSSRGQTVTQRGEAKKLTLGRKNFDPPKIWPRTLQLGSELGKDNGTTDSRSRPIVARAPRGARCPPVTQRWPICEAEIWQWPANCCLPLSTDLHQPPSSFPSFSWFLDSKGKGNEVSLQRGTAEESSSNFGH